MNKILIIIGLLLFGFHATSQNNMAGYAYWFDHDFESQIETFVSPTEILGIDMLIGTEGLSNGLHVLNFRSWDENGLYSSITNQFFYKIPNQTMMLQREIVGYEYWLDNNYESAQSQTIIGTPTFDYLEVLSVSDLGSGIHTFNIRFKDNIGQWSSIVNQFFYKVPEITMGINKELVSYEYWFDNGFDEAISVEIMNQEVVNVTELLDLSGLNSGLHSFNIRFKDNTGQWSSIVNQFFYKIPELVNAVEKEIVGYQYWIDESFENAQFLSVSGTSILNLSSTLDLADLSNGLHTISIRFIDNSESWSSILTQFVYKVPVMDGFATNKVVGYRYWFNDDFDNSVFMEAEEPAEILELVDVLDLSQMESGEYSIHFQFKDSLNFWSSVTSDTLFKNSLPVAFFDYSMVQNCDSTLINFEDLSVDADVYDWDFGDGGTSDLESPIHTYQNSGDYLVSLTVSDTISGLDSTLNTLIVIESLATFATLEASACDNYTAPSGLTVWNETGIYADTLINYLGCDSILEIDLTILNSSMSELQASSCDPYESPSGDYVWENTGLYTDTLVNTLGCDSIVIVDLTILESTTSNLTESSCDNYLSPSGLYLWEESGVYQDTLINMMGCDSILTIDLTINTANIDVTNNDPVLVADAEGASYQWIDCSTMEPIEGEMGQEFEAITNGSYAVQIIQNGCEALSECETVMNVGIVESGLAREISVYPNPTRDQVWVNMGMPHASLTVKLHTTRGELVREFELKNSSGFELHLPDASGLYFLSIIAEGKSARIKVIKE